MERIRQLSLVTQVTRVKMRSFTSVICAAIGKAGKYVHHYLIYLSYRIETQLALEGSPS